MKLFLFCRVYDFLLFQRLFTFDNGFFIHTFTCFYFFFLNFFSLSFIQAAQHIVLAIYTHSVFIISILCCCYCDFIPRCRVSFQENRPFTLSCLYVFSFSLDLASVKLLEASFICFAQLWPASYSRLECWEFHICRRRRFFTPASIFIVRCILLFVSARD